MPGIRLPDLELVRTHLSEKWGLDWDLEMQDWDLCNANPSLLPLLARELERDGLSISERVVVMELALASMDLSVEANGVFSREWSVIEAELISNIEDHWESIYYWASPVVSGESGWSISNRMLDIYKMLPERFR